MEASKNLPSPHLYDAYLVRNEPNRDIMIPGNSCYGAIGITIDEKTTGVAHTGLDLLNQVSLNLQNIESKDETTGSEYRKFMHAFVVTNQFEPTALSVCEAVKEGIVKAEIKMGDTDWTSMVLFIPKDLRASEKIAKNATLELHADETGRVASYAFGEGLKSLFSTKAAKLSEKNTELIASEMADLIKGRSIRSDTGGAKSTVCSQLAIRILRASLLESKLTEEQIKDYRSKNIDVLRKGLASELIKAESPVAELYRSSRIFMHEAHVEALPFELYRMLMGESDFHG